jgi:hypothetical protein
VQHPTPNLEDQVSVFMTPGDRVVQLYPRHWAPILVDFYDMHGLQWDYSLILATTRERRYYRNMEWQEVTRNVVVKRLTQLLRIREFPGLNLG